MEGRICFRQARREDLDAVEAIYDRIHDLEERGEINVGWQRNVYPVRATAERALAAGELFVALEGGRVCASAVLNRVQPDGYDRGGWRYLAEPDRVMVMHTLTVDPSIAGMGVGSAFARFYEDLARDRKSAVLRIDTQAGNARARSLYRRLGYTEAGIITCDFNGIADVPLVLLEKPLT